MARKSFTLIVVPDNESNVRRFRVQQKWILQAGVAAGLLLLFVVVGTGHYFVVAKDASENKILREENLTLRTQLKSIAERVEHINSTLDRVERFDAKLRALTLLSDPQRNLAMGPTAADPSSQVPASADNAFARTLRIDPSAVSAKLDKLSADALRQEQNLQELQAYFQDQRSMLASIPSLWPSRGWVTSDFGLRDDPYTSDRVSHQGMDIAAPHGKEVLAPSDGTVVFSGLEGAYGKVLVIDHGYGIKTRYGHLAQILVKAGERVKRGLQVASVGNTGRSTGPHLHYEVRVNGVPQNPRKFILEE